MKTRALYSNSHITACFLKFLLQERQQFHLEQLRAAEFRARAAAQQQLARSEGGTAPAPTQPPQGVSPQAPQASQQPSQPPPPTAVAQ